MKSLIQNYSNGKISLEEIPTPKTSGSQILVKNSYSVVSIGTEGSMVKLAKKSIIGKALARPDLVRRVFQKLSQTSLKETTQIVLNKLDTPINLGYSASGVVAEVGPKVTGYKKGDFVSIIGSGFATHSEYNLVPASMCSKIEEEFLKESSFGMLGCIAMHATRQFRFNLNGKNIAILGSGLLGNLATQILNSYGAQTFSYDPSEEKSEVLLNMGFNSSSDSSNLEKFAKKLRFGGFDGVLLACAVNDNKPLQQALDILRVNGEIVIMGVVDIKLDRNEMWEKQASIIVSKAGGFGALDDDHYSSKENHSLDSIKWTEKNNLDEINRLIRSGRINIKKIITSEIDFNTAVNTYEKLIKGEMNNDLGIIFSYDNTESKPKKLFEEKVKTDKNDICLGVIGAGNHAVSNFLPELKKINGSHKLKMLATNTPVKADHYSKKFNFESATCDKKELINNPNINNIISLERHSNHFETIKECIYNKKNLLIEKPLVSNRSEFLELKEILKNQKEIPKIMVGHNRRYISSVNYLRQAIDQNNPGILNLCINAGKIEKSHWLYDEKEGGNRVVAEGSHFIDLIKFITNSDIVSLSSSNMSTSDYLEKENFIVSFKHKNGFLSNLIYTSIGSRNMPRETIEVFQDGEYFSLIDFKKYKHFGSSSSKKSFTYDLGFKKQIENFFAYANDKHLSSSIDEEMHTMDIVLKISEELNN